jgi:myo-inositol-1-phosphate synthase
MDVHTLAMPIEWHEQCEWEISVAYEDGVRDGIRLYAAVVDDAVLAALARPRGHGGPDLDVEARERVTDLFRRYLGVGLAPAGRR